MSIAERMFAKIDADGGGSISVQEWVAIFKTFDKDGNKQIDAGEFSAGFKAAFGGTDTEAKKAFSKIDADGSGEITLDEITDFFKQMDKDGSGEVDKEEFMAVWGKVF